MFEILEVYSLIGMNWMTKHPRLYMPVLAVYRYLDGRQPCHRDLTDQTWIFSWARKLQKRTAGHTLCRVITGTSDLNATSIERIRIHSLAANIIRLIGWTIVIVYYILRVLYFFNLATIFNFKSIRHSFHRTYKLLNVLVNGSVWTDNTVGRGWRQTPGPRSGIRAISNWNVLLSIE